VFENRSLNSLLNYITISQFFLLMLFNDILHILLILLSYMLLLQLRYMFLRSLCVALNFYIDNDFRTSSTRQLKFLRYRSLTTSYVFAFTYVIFKKFVQNNISIFEYHFVIFDRFFKFISSRLINEIKI